MENFDKDDNIKQKKKRGLVRGLIGWILYLALLAGLIFGTPRVLSHFLKSEYPMAAITSGSMWPTLKRGDLVLIQGIKGKEEIRVGDIVVYQIQQGFTIHRVVELRNTQLVTKGDANNTEDNPVAYKDIIGKTVEFRGKPFRIPKLGNVSILLNR